MTLFCLPVLAIAFAAADPATIDRLANESLQAWKAPGAAVAILGPEGILYQKGYGVKRLGSPDPVTPGTIFAIGSTTKAFTVAALGILVDEGRIHWDDPVRKHLPEFQLADPHASELVTIRDLVSHRTGLSRNDTLWYGSPWSREEILDRISRVALTKPFRSAWQYQNIMYLAAGQLAARVSGARDWEDFVQRRILDPLGMKDTTFTTSAAELSKDHASPHVKRDSGKVEPVTWRNLDNIGPAGSINSNVIDLAKWVRAQMNGGSPILKPATLREMHTPQMAMRPEEWGRNVTDETNQMTYGMGWFLQDFRGRHVVSHGGAIDGFRAQITILPNQRQAVIVMANLGSDNMPEALRWKIVDHLLETPQSKDWDSYLIAKGKAAADAEKAAFPKRIEGTKPSAALAAYAGDYKHPGYGIARVTLNPETNALHLAWSSSQLTLSHFHYDTFVNDRSLATFSLSAAGAVRTLRFQGVDFERIQPALDPVKTAALFVRALAPARGEKAIVRYDPGYLRELTGPAEAALRDAGVTIAATLPYAAKGKALNGCSDFVKLLDDATIYLWMPLDEEKREVTGCETRALAKWLDTGGTRRQIHFHWSGGSVLADGLPTAHQPEFDHIYAHALEVDYEAMSRRQDEAIAKLRSGVVRVHTPAGTDITFRTGDRPFNKQDGDASGRRMAAVARVRVDREIELPAGVLRVAPLEETANGILAVPEARFGSTIARDVRFTIESGRVTKVAAASGIDAVEAALREGGDAARRFREFGLGFNPRLIAPKGSRILPYFAYGTGMVRMSLGDNEEIGGKVRGLYRRWFFFPDATVEVDGAVVSRPAR